MKLATFLLIIALVQASAKGYSQKISLNEKNAPLENVLNDIKSQSGYSFFYDSQLVKNEKVTVSLNNADIKAVLDACFRNLPITYKIVQNNIVLAEKESNLVDQLKSQIKAELFQATVSGKVIDDLGQSMVGVTVTVKGTKTASVTDTKGVFTITAQDDNSLLVFSFVGYETKEIPIRQLVNGSVITLNPSVTNLREVAINKGYYYERQELTTGDVSTVDGKIIAEQPGINAAQALEGRVPGLFVSQGSGIPGGNEMMHLQGTNSIANGNSPLFIVDGVPFGSFPVTNPGARGSSALGIGLVINTESTATGMSPFNLINSDDIDNIEVLKGPDATAIYGSRGANGVILITTKKGKAGDVKVNVDLSQGVGQVTRMMNLLNTQQYLQMRHNAIKNDNLTVGSRDYDLNGVWDTTRYTNWQKVLIGNTAHYTNAQANVSGGTENTQFYVGGGYSRQTTVFPGDYSDIKGSLHFNLNHSSTNKRFQLQFSGSYLNDNSNLPVEDLTPAALTLAPDAPAIYTPNGSINWQPVGGTSTWLNPLATYTFRNSNAITNNLLGNLNLGYKILPGLFVKSSFGYTDITGNQSNQYLENSYGPPNNTNVNNRVNDFGNNESKTWIVEPQLSYDRQIGKGKLSALFGYSLQQTSYNYDSFTAVGFTSDALIENPLNATTKTLATYSNTLYRYSSIYARLNYTWDDKYLLNATVRRDGSSRFGPSKEYGNFGAVGIGWIFSKEKFAVNDLPWLSFGKIRGGYGITGNDQILDYQYLSSYSTNTPTYQGITGLFPSRIANPYYAWEVDKKLEAALDLSFLKDRINFTFDYFRNRSGNQLVGFSLPSISGFATLQENLPAIVQNTGVEISLNTVNIKSGDFTWTTALNLTIPKNKLVSYDGLSTSANRNFYEIGQPLSIKKLYNFVGIDPQTGVMQYAGANGPTASPTSTDQVFSKPITQQLYGGFQNSIHYKNFQLDIFIQFVKQTGLDYVYNSLNYDNVGSENINIPTAVFQNMWQNPGDIVRYGKASPSFKMDPAFVNQNSDAIITDASFIRLKNVALYYRLPASWQKAIGAENARIYIRGQNLLTFTNYLGPDPETQGQSLPPLRMFTAGVAASF